MDRSTRVWLVDRIMAATGDPPTSRALWESLCKHTSQSVVETCLESLESRREKIKNPGAWMNRVLGKAVASGG